MSRLLRYISLVAVTVVMLACGNTQRSVEMHNPEHSRWAEYEDFYYDNVDTLSKRDIAIAVRYGKGYVADSVALSILCVSPDSLVSEEPFTIHIPHLADMRPEVQTFPYRRNVVLGTKGRYLFRLRPDNAIDGISSVGLVISDVEDRK
ncbi:MAG: hypothetical protein IKY51_01205 [Alistipes sp.]|nr:hypothetical protein [Alistipes sp.]